MAPRSHTDSFTRAIIVTLKSRFVGKSTSQISEILGISPRTIDAIFSRACLRGFEPNGPTLKVLPEHLEDAPRSGRPRKQEAIHEPTVDKVRRDRYAEMSTSKSSWLDSYRLQITDHSLGRATVHEPLYSGDLSLYGYDVSPTTVWRVLKAAGYKKTKPTSRDVNKQVKLA
ncbi:HTH-Tnp-Tc3-2 multi-domain protein [Pyrenophora tritici-repentis]|nr:HTH-Tnp-Tc3-2 multi-domain protein [Pyrenophora tritici-repentis]